MLGHYHLASLTQPNRAANPNPQRRERSEMISPLDALTRYLLSLQRAEFYGDVVIHFRKGEITSLNLNQTLKPNELPQSVQPMTERESPHVQSYR